MPVIELTESETRTVDRELMLDYVSQLAIEDRRHVLEQMPGALEHARSMWFGRATTQKASTLTYFVRDRVLPSGERAELPSVYYWVRCPVDNLLLLFWGEDAVVEDGRVRLRMPYEPLPRYLDPDELARLRSWTGPKEGSRFAEIDLS